MNAQSNTKTSVIQNHKKIHKYKPMELEDIEKFWYKELVNKQLNGR
jgi:hypothetical protein